MTLYEECADCDGMGCFLDQPLTPECNACGGHGVKHLNAEQVRLFVAAPAMLAAAREVMSALEEYGPSIVGHLLDNDCNAGERLRAAIRHADGERA